MRKLLLTAIALVVMTGCPRKQINTSGTGYGFEGKRIYTIAVFPLLVRGSISPDEFQRDSLYSRLVNCLILTGRFEEVDPILVEQAVSQSEVAGALSSEKTRQAGKDLGADVVCLAEVNVKQTAPPVVLAKVDILPVTGNSPSYTGSGRAGDPASWLTAARLALDSATARIVK